jgi:hypothetical protein
VPACDEEAPRSGAATQACPAHTAIVTLNMFTLDARSEDVLAAMAGAHAPVREVRAVRDKFTGAPRGFCFLHLHSISDAARVMQLLQARRPARARPLQAGPGPAPGIQLGVLFNFCKCCGACFQRLSRHLQSPCRQAHLGSARLTARRSARGSARRAGRERGGPGQRAAAVLRARALRAHGRRCGRAGGAHDSLRACGSSQHAGAPQGYCAEAARPACA